MPENMFANNEWFKDGKSLTAQGAGECFCPLGLPSIARSSLHANPATVRHAAHRVLLIAQPDLCAENQRT